MSTTYEYYVWVLLMTLPTAEHKERRASRTASWDHSFVRRASWTSRRHGWLNSPCRTIQSHLICANSFMNRQKTRMTQFIMHNHPNASHLCDELHEQAEDTDDSIHYAEPSNHISFVRRASWTSRRHRWLNSSCITIQSHGQRNREAGEHLWYFLDHR